MKSGYCLFIYFVLTHSACCDDLGLIKNAVETAPTAVAVGMMADGVSNVMSGHAQEKANSAARRDRDGYATTFRCKVAGKEYNVGVKDTVTLPNIGAEFLAMRSEYLILAQKLKNIKKHLGIQPGIESQEVIADASDLYDYSQTGGIVHVLNDTDDASDQVARGLDSLQVGMTAALVANVGKIFPDANENVETQSTINTTKEVPVQQTSEQCPAKYCQGGSEYTDEETCEAWKLCGCQDGPSPADVCATERGKALCECE